MGFGLVDQTKVVTASSELARNMIDYGGGGTVQIEVVENDRRSGLGSSLKIRDPVFPTSNLPSKTATPQVNGMGLGLGGAKRLSHEFEIQSKVGRGHAQFPS